MSSTTTNPKEAADRLSPPFTPDDIKLIRKSFRLSQGDFARLLRVPKTWVQKREQGVYGLSEADTSLYQAILHMRKHGCILDWIDDCN